MKTDIEKSSTPGIWMEIKVVVNPDEYRVLKNAALKKSLGVAEWVSQMIREIIKKGATQ